MSPAEAAAILFAGLAAGTINTIVGSGTLVTFPLLVALGYAPVTANVTSTVGLAPGGLSGAFGYRRELGGHGAELPRLVATAGLGGTTGAVLLLALPSEAFDVIVPVFIVVSVVLVLLKPHLAGLTQAASGRHGSRYITRAGVYGCGIYGGYFGAAQGVLLLAVLGLTMPGNLQRTNAMKNVLAAAVNVVAGLIFVLVAPVAWMPAVLLAAGSMAGGQVGALTARSLSERVLRAFVVAVGIAAFFQLTFN